MMTRTKWLGWLVILYSIGALVVSLVIDLPDGLLIYLYLFNQGPNRPPLLSILERVFLATYIISGIGLILRKESALSWVLAASSGSLILSYIFLTSIETPVGFFTLQFEALEFPVVLLFLFKAIPNLFFLSVASALKFFQLDTDSTRPGVVTVHTSGGEPSRKPQISDTFQKRYAKILFWGIMATGPVIVIMAGLIAGTRSLFSGEPIMSVGQIIYDALLLFIPASLPVILLGFLVVLLFRSKWIRPVGFFQSYVAILPVCIAAVITGIPLYYEVWKCAECIMAIFIVPFYHAFWLGIATVAGAVAAVLCGFFFQRIPA